MRIITVTVACVVALTAAIASSPAQAVTKDFGNVMCMGDSITEGLSSGYRDPLYRLLTTPSPTTNAVYSLKYVGSLTTSSSVFLNNAGQNHHEGHGGHLICGTAAGAPMPGLYEKLETWIGTTGSTSPNTILLMIGANDINVYYDLPNAPARLSNLIAKIYSYLPNVTIDLATVTPQSDATKNARVRAFNAALPAIVSDYRDNKHKSINLVDIYGALNNTTDLSADGLHPSAAGFNKIAQTWYSTLTTTATPEPSSVVLLGTGFVALLGYAWRKRKKN